MKKVKYIGIGLRTYNYKKVRKKISKKIWVLLSIAVFIIILSVLLGKYLQYKVENSLEGSSFYEYYEDEIPTSEKSNFIISNKGEGEDENEKKIQGMYFDYTQYDTKKDIARALNEAVASAYNTITLSITDENGDIIYNSSIMEEYFRLPTPQSDDFGDKKSNSEQLDINEKFLYTIEVAKENELYVSVFLPVKSDIIYGKNTIEASAMGIFDTLLMREIHEMGADEIILYGLDSPNVEIITIKNTIISYINAIKKESPDISVVIVISPKYFSEGSFAPYIEEIFASADFLAIDLFSLVESCTEEEIFDNVNSICSSLSGSFAYYNIRAMISGITPAAKADQLDALTVNTVHNWQFVTKNQYIPEENEEDIGNGSRTDTENINKE